MSQLKSGITGAAWATVISQYVGVTYLLTKGLFRLEKSLVKHNLGKLSIRNIKKSIQLPNKSEIKSFVSFTSPLLFVLFTKCFLWSFTTYVTSAFGADSLAAHQIVISFFLYFTIFGDVVSTMSQNFLPSFLSVTNSINKNGKKLLLKIFSISFIAGISNSLLGFALPYVFPHLFTKSGSVVSIMKSIAFPLAFATIPHSLLTAIEGVLISVKDLNFLFLFYNVFAFYFIVAQSIVLKYNFGLLGVWWAMASYQWLRLLVFSTRLYRTTLSAAGSADAPA